LRNHRFLKSRNFRSIPRQLAARKFIGENFWARGYAVSTVGYDIEAIKKYIRDQEESENNETNR
jgi:putative transposase